MLWRTNAEPCRIINSESTDTILVHVRHSLLPYTISAATSNTRGRSDFYAELLATVTFAARKVRVSIIFSSAPLSAQTWPRQQSANTLWNTINDSSGASCCLESESYNISWAFLPVPGLCLSRNSCRIFGFSFSEQARQSFKTWWALLSLCGG